MNGTTRGSHAFQFARAGLLQAGSPSRASPLQALLWGVFASFALCLLLVDLFLIASS